MAKVVESLNLDYMEKVKLDEEFKNENIRFQFGLELTDADRQAIKNTVALALNRIHSFGLQEYYVESYGKLWRMWIGEPTQEEIKNNPFEKPKDPLYQFMDLLLNPNETLKKEKKEGD